MFGFIDTVSLDELKFETVLLSTRSTRNRNLSLQPLGVVGSETPHVDLIVWHSTPILVIFCHCRPMGHRRSQLIHSGRFTKRGVDFKNKQC